MAWDIRTAAYTGKNFNVSSQTTSLFGLFFSPDGTNLYVLDYSVHTIYQYSLVPAWDINSAVYITSCVLGTSQPHDLYISPDGTQLYVSSGGNIFYCDQYSLSTAWDISTASFIHSYYNTTYGKQPYGIFLSSDGTKIYSVTHGDSYVNQYSLSTPWDVTTAAYLQRFNFS